jgi:hypothetical protein
MNAFIAYRYGPEQVDVDQLQRLRCQHRPQGQMPGRRHHPILNRTLAPGHGQIETTISDFPRLSLVNRETGFYRAEVTSEFWDHTGFSAVSRHFGILAPYGP